MDLLGYEGHSTAGGPEKPMSSASSSSQKKVKFNSEEYGILVYIEMIRRSNNIINILIIIKIINFLIILINLIFLII